MQDKWGHSRDGELYYGNYDTKEEAIEAGRNEESSRVGQYRAPVMPWDCLDAGTLFDHVLCQDDYQGEWAEDAFECTREQEKDLEQRIAIIVKAWCEENGFVPNFGIVEYFEDIAN